MLGESPFGGWLPWRELERVVGRGVEVGLDVGRALFPNVPITPAQMLQTAIQTIGEQFLHRRVRFRAGGSIVTMTPVELDCRVDSIGLARGQFAAIRMTAENVRWGDVRLQRLTLICRDIRLRSVYAPALVFGSVEVHVAVAAKEVREQVARLHPELTVDIGRDRAIRAHWARVQRAGHLVIEPRVEQSTVYLQPTTAGVSRVRLDVVRRIRPWTIEIPPLPYGLRVTAVEAGDRQLLLYGISDQARERLSNIPINELLGLVRAAVRIL